MLNKVNLVRDFDTEYMVVLREQVNASRNYGVDHKLVFKTKGPYRVLDKATSRSYWVQGLTFLLGYREA